MSYGDRIPNVYQGEVPSLLDATLANKLIDSINALNKIEVKKGDKNEVLYSRQGVTIFIDADSTTEAHSHGATGSGTGTEGYSDIMC
jgi:hypothetical protein